MAVRGTHHAHATTCTYAPPPPVRAHAHTACENLCYNNMAATLYSRLTAEIRLHVDHERRTLQERVGLDEQGFLQALNRCDGAIAVTPRHACRAAHTPPPWTWRVSRIVPRPSAPGPTLCSRPS